MEKPQAVGVTPLAWPRSRKEVHGLQPFHNATRLRRSGHAAGKALGRDFLILDLDSGRYFDAGESGGLIWEHLEHGATVAELAETVATCYSIDIERALTDVCVFLTELLAEGLIQADPETAP